MPKIINLLPRLKKWTPEEAAIFEELYQFRKTRARRCEYINGYSEEYGPFFTLSVIETGEVIMHIDRTLDGKGYSITGPTRDPAECDTLEQLYAVYVAFDASAFPRMVVHKNK